MPAQSSPSGYRHVVAMGNTQHRRTWTLTLPGSGPYWWSVQAVDGVFAGSPFAPEQSTAQSGVGVVAAPAGITLASGPNPFARATTIRVGQPKGGRVLLGVYDVAGRSVRVLHEGPLGSGIHERTWDGRDNAGRAVSPGVYLYRYEIAGDVMTRKMVLMR